MTTDAEFDDLIRKSMTIAEETDKLLDEAAQQNETIAAWRRENGLTDEVVAKLDKALTPELRSQLEAEMEKASIDDAHDLEAEIANRMDKPASHPKRNRNYV